MGGECEGKGLRCLAWFCFQRNRAKNSAHISSVCALLARTQPFATPDNKGTGNGVCRVPRENSTGEVVTKADLKQPGLK